MQFLKIKQIYFSPDQLSKCDYEPYFNENCTVYFENSVISKLIADGQHKDCEYFGVVSHKLRDKVNTCRRGPRINITRFDKAFFEERLRELRPDVMGFLQYEPHDPVRYFQSMHTELPRLFEKVVPDWKPEKYEHVFYGNHFVARSEIYEQYVNELLNPAIKKMDEMGDELFGNSGYPFDLPVDLQRKFGAKHYTYHSFICERLFSYWVHLNGLEVKYY